MTCGEKKTSHAWPKINPGIQEEAQAPAGRADVVPWLHSGNFISFHIETYCM